MLKGLVVLLAAGTLSACAWNPARFDKAQIDTMMAAKPSCSDVVASLGRPSAYTPAARNYETIFYTDHIIYSGLDQAIPVAGPFIGGVQAHTDLLVFSCDQNGRVAEYQYGEIKRVVDARYSSAATP